MSSKDKHQETPTSSAAWAGTGPTGTSALPGAIRRKLVGKPGNADVLGGIGGDGADEDNPGNADVLGGIGGDGANGDNPGSADVLVGIGGDGADGDNPGSADVLVGMGGDGADEDNPGSADVLVGIGGDGADEDNPGSADVLVGIGGDGADGDVGAPRGAHRELDGNGGNGGASREWYSRGYLPHRDRSRLIQSVSFRLADSLPLAKLETLKQELAMLPEGKREVEFRRRMESWLDAGMGCCALRHPEVARYVQDSFLHFHGERYDLHAWCIMPNHVHILVEPITDLATIIQGWKSFTARWILQQDKRLGLRIPQNRHVWMREYWDRYIRNPDHYQKAVEYIHQNPVKAGLCRSPEDWPWSSYKKKANGDNPGNADVLVGIVSHPADGDVGAPRADRHKPGNADVLVGIVSHPADGDVGAPRADRHKPGNADVLVGMGGEQANGDNPGNADVLVGSFSHQADGDVGDSQESSAP